MATQQEIDALRKKEEELALMDAEAKKTGSHSPSSLKAKKVLDDIVAKKKAQYKTEGEDAVKAAKERSALPLKMSKAAVATVQSILNKPKNDALAELAKAETTLSEMRKKEWDDIKFEKHRQISQGHYTELGRLMKEVKDSLPTADQQRAKDESFLTAKTQGLGYNTGVGRNTEGRGVLIGGMGEGQASRKIYSDDPKDIATHQRAKAQSQQNMVGGAPNRSRRSAELAAAKMKLGNMQVEGFKRIAAQREAGKDEDYNRLQARKGFARKLHNLRFDPSKSDEKQRTALYGEGDAMGLTPQQIDSYTQKYLRPANAAQRVAGGGGGVGSPYYTGPNQRQLGAGSLRIGSLSDPAAAIAPKWTKMARAARRLRRKGYLKEAGKMALATEGERLGSPAIRSDGFRAADDLKQNQIRDQKEKDAAMKRQLIQQMLNSSTTQQGY